MIGGRELKVPSRDRGGKSARGLENFRGKIVDSFFDRELGGWWKLDLSNAYKDVLQVRRSVIHFFPGIVAVLDEAKLLQKQEISLRWHTIDKSEPEKNGNFLVKAKKSTLSGFIQNLNKTEIKLKRHEHSYHPPFDKNRLGDPLDQRNENYIEAKIVSSECRLLSLFSVNLKLDHQPNWNQTNSNWQIKTAEGINLVEANSKELSVSNKKTTKKLTIDLT